jgi:hypothetical protein
MPGALLKNHRRTSRHDGGALSPLLVRSDSSRLFPGPLAESWAERV